MDGYEDLGLRGGLWRGQIRRAGPPGRVLLVHMGEVLAEAEVAPGVDGLWQVSVAVPADRLTDGAVTFALHEDAGAAGEPLQPGSAVLATLPLIAGKALHRDLRAELTLLRAEVDLLKREFRRHAADAAGSAAREAGPAVRTGSVQTGSREDPAPPAPGADRDAQGEVGPEPQEAAPVPPLDAPVETARPEPG